MNILDALKGNDLCITTQSECNERFSLECYDNICGKNAKSCHDFKMFMMLTKSSRNLKAFSNMRSFTVAINACERKAYKWKKSDVCLKEGSCFAKEYQPFLKTEFKLTLITNPDECKCGNEHKELCHNQNYCGLNQEACKGLKINHSIQKCSKYLFLSKNFI